MKTQSPEDKRVLTVPDRTLNTASDKALIAVPYYGSLSHPPSGLTRIYFLVNVDLAEMKIAELSLQVWNPKKEPNLFRWLRQVETDGVICSDSPSKYEVGLKAEGMWVQWGQEGEVHEVVHRWMRSRPDRAQSSRTCTFTRPEGSRATETKPASKPR
jgi:hypothetical protein